MAGFTMVGIGRVPDSIVEFGPLVRRPFDEVISHGWAVTRRAGQSLQVRRRNRRA